MDENLALLLYGCKLAKNLENNLPMLANQPDNLLISCAEIITVFCSLRERLIVSLSGQTSAVGQHQKIQRLDDHHVDATILEWLRTDSTTTTTTFAGEPMAGLSITPSNTSNFNKNWPAGGQQLTVGGSSGKIKPTMNNAPDSIRTKPRTRKDEGHKLVKRVPTPQMGNLDLPPEDGYTWRKYGQKEILGSAYPRSYYRCTHQKLYDCPAKKQVQRLEDDPFTFEVTYRENHTCHVSSTATAPSPEQRTAPPPTTAPPMTLFSSSSLPAAQWLSTQLLQNLGGNPSISGASPSARRFPDYQLPVADMADVMFNSASSSSNSMDLIFSAMDDKWDSEEKKD